MIYQSYYIMGTNLGINPITFPNSITYFDLVIEVLRGKKLDIN